jgi:hypothetical protein
MRKIFTLALALLITGAVVTVQTNAVPKRMVVEFCTGTWCGWCPCGHTAADEILVTYPNTIFIAYHGASTDPWQNFNGNAIRSMLGFAAYPTGIFDRTNHPGNGSSYPYITYTMWSSYAASRMNSTPNSMVNVLVTSNNYNPTTREISTTVNCTAEQNLTDQYKIVFVLTEDNVVYPQYFYASCGSPVGYHNDYIHEYIARSVMNNVNGENLNTGTWNQNQTITKTITATLDPTWVAANCNVNVIVYKDNPSGLFLSAVEQGAKQSVTGMVGISGNNGEIPASYSLSQNYPNPFNPNTHINISLPYDGNATLTIYNTSGQEVMKYLDGFVKAGVYNVDFDGSELSSGIYFYTLKAGNFVETKKMILVK